MSQNKRKSQKFARRAGYMSRLNNLIAEYKALGISEQINYDKLYLYSIITHSTAIEGSTVTEIENQLLFDEGISPNKSMGEQLMNLFII